MSPQGQRRRPERLLELRRDWRGRLRRLRRAPPYRDLPFWARLGLAAPGVEWTLTLLACACALAGGVLVAMVFAPGGAR